MTKYKNLHIRHIGRHSKCDGQHKEDLSPYVGVVGGHYPFGGPSKPVGQYKESVGSYTRSGDCDIPVIGSCERVGPVYLHL